MFRPIGAAIAVALAVCAPPAHATLIAGDSFATKIGGGAGFYTHNATIHGQPAAATSLETGFAGPYQGGDPSTILQADLNGATTPAYTTSAGGGVHINSFAGTATYTRPLAAYQPANTYYFAGSMRGHTVQTAAQSTLIEFSNHAPTTLTDLFDASDRGFQFGLSGSDAVLRARNTAGALTNFVLSSSYRITNGNGNVFIGKIEFNPSGNGTDRITIYFNPSDLSTEAAAAATGTTTVIDTDALATNADIQYLGFAAIKTGTGVLTYTRGDELRFGTAYEDATAPLPEPGTAGLLALAAATRLARRRRSR